MKKTPNLDGFPDKQRHLMKNTNSIQTLVYIENQKRTFFNSFFKAKIIKSNEDTKEEKDGPVCLINKTRLAQV